MSKLLKLASEPQHDEALDQSEQQDLKLASALRDSEWSRTSARYSARRGPVSSSVVAGSIGASAHMKFEHLSGCLASLQERCTTRSTDRSNTIGRAEFVFKQSELLRQLRSLYSL